jgi:hypothetical protein
MWTDSVVEPLPLLAVPTEYLVPSWEIVFLQPMVLIKTTFNAFLLAHLCSIVVDVIDG